MSGILGEPFRESMGVGRLDWNISSNARLFYRFTYDQNSQVRPFGATSSFAPFANKNNTPVHGVGLDFTTGKWTHSIRFGYLKFRNGIADVTAGLPAAQNPVPGVSVNLGAVVFGPFWQSGPNILAPQKTFQSNHQIKYDGSRMLGSHILRYGFAYNRIRGGGFASFFGAGPAMSDITGPFTNPDPASYPTQILILGNGAGCGSEKPAFGFPCGGFGPDNRIEWYFGDSWKVTRRFTFNAALHYVRDDGRSDGDAPVVSGLNSFLPGFGNPPRNPGKNFGPQAGFAWDVTGSGRTVIRGGGGLFFENSIWNNVLFDRPIRLANGSFLDTPLVCAFAPVPFSWPGGAAAVPASPLLTNNGDGTASVNNICNQPVGTAGANILAVQSMFQAAQAAVGATGANAVFFNTNNAVIGGNNTIMIDPNYRTPRSVQMNIGVQHELRPGTVLTADYIRNIGTHFNLVVDRNHMGDVRNFNAANAIAARDAAQTSVGCPAGPGQAGCVLAAVGGDVPTAQSVYSNAGLDSGNQVAGGFPCPTCAFTGNNPAFGQIEVNEPWGRSVYNGLQVSLKHDASNLFGSNFVKHANFQVSYSLGKFISQVQDQDFTSTASDFNNPLKFTGWNALDRKHQISFGAVFNLPWYTQLSFIGHFDSPLPATLFLPNSTGGPGEIFVSDVTGDGTVGDIVPGTNVGSFQRNFGISGVQGVINNYNSNFPASLTPAGQAVVGAGVMTAADMQSLNWTMQPLANVVPGAIGFGWLKTFDFKMSWPIKLGERFTLEPSVGFYNVFNMRNEFLPGNLPTGVLSDAGNGFISSGAIGGTTQFGAPASACPPLNPTPAPQCGTEATAFRASMQSGTFALGAPRQTEFGLRFTF